MILVHDYAGHPFEVQLSRALAGAGHRVVHAFAGSLQTPRGSLSPRDGSLEIIEIPMNAGYVKHKYSFLRRRAYELEYGREVARLIDRLGPQVVLSANTPTEAQEEIVRACRRNNARFVYWIQDFYSLAVGKLLRKKLPGIGLLASSYYEFLERRQMRMADHVVPITEDFIPTLAKWNIPPSRITVAPNWAPLDEMPLHARDNEWSRGQGFAGKKLLLYSGTLGMKHNPALLLALAEAFRDQEDVQVVVISEGLGMTWLQERKRALGTKNLHLLPYQPFEKLPMVLASAEILIAILEPDAGQFSVPSKVLTYLCANRALLCAIPSENLAARIVVQAEAGVVVPPDDREAFVGGARRLLAEPEHRQRCAERARAYAEDHFEIDHIRERFEKILKED